MQDIKVGRYSAEGAVVDGEYVPGAGEFFGGWIEPEDASWIIFLDPNGYPVVYFDTRSESGAVTSDGIVLHK